MTAQPVATALWITASGRAERRTEPLSPRPEGFVRVRTITSGISRGTESLILRGGVPISEAERMRAPFQHGAFPFPVKYGYAAVGTIIEGPPARIGQTIFCLHPHQDVFDIPADAALPVPADVPPARAVLAPQIETALNATWDAAIGIGATIAIIGSGVIGALIGYLCTRLPATDVTLIDRQPDRRALAEHLGCRFRTADNPPDAVCDVVFHTSGTGDGLDLAIGCAGFEAKLIELSWYGDRPVTIHLGGAFHSRRLTLLSSQVSHVAATHRARWPHRRRLALALALCADPALDRLTDAATPFEQSAQRYGEILSDPATMCHRFNYRGD